MVLLVFSSSARRRDTVVVFVRAVHICLPFCRLCVSDESSSRLSLMKFIRDFTYVQRKRALAYRALRTIKSKLGAEKKSEKSEA